MEIPTKSRTVGRWILLGVGVSLLLGLSYLLVKLFRQDLYPLISSQEFSSSFEILLLINMNIVVLVVLGFLVVKNIFKLVLDRKKNVLGSKLRSRLVAAFFLLALIPTALLFIVAKGIVDSVLQDWFAPQVANAVESSKNVLELYYDERIDRLEQSATAVANTLSTASPFLARISSDSGELVFDAVKGTKFLEDLKSLLNLDDISLYSISNGYVLGTSDANFGQPSMARVNRAFLGENIVTPEQHLEGEVLRTYLPVSLRGELRIMPGEPITFGGTHDFVLVVSSGISGEVSDTLSSAISAHDEYRELTTYRKPVASTYLLTLVIVTMMVVFAAIWVGFYIARTITGPILQLVDGTRAIATGKLKHRIPEVGDDEISILIRSFNAMAEDLHSSTSENTARRKYMETVLNHVELGVVAIDKAGRVTTSNPAAKEILDFSCYSTPIGLLLVNLVEEPLRGEFERLLIRLKRGESPITRTIALGKGENTKHLKITSSLFSGDTGAVIIVDDMSTVISAQRMAAWREVAQRIAHEIKNPLTPIQLTAQRIERRVSSYPDEPLQDLVREGTKTIVSQVAVLRELVSEFSKFARLPEAKPVPTNLNELAKETVSLFKESHPEIQFDASLYEELPSISVDPDQIRRVVLNLLDNAVSAVKTYQESGGRVQISTSLEEGAVALEVSDTGVGIDMEEYSRVFEPYYSTKQRGTGLGLAIVNTIVSDHKGVISIRPVQPHGACFRVEFPYVCQEEPKSVNS